MKEAQIQAEIARLKTLSPQERPPFGILREAAILILEYREELQFGPLYPYTNGDKHES